MAKINVARQPIFTHEGAIAKHISAEQQLRRSVMACLLWEDEFYESGQSIAARIAELVPKVEAQNVAKMAIEARVAMKLRHAPLWLAREMARHAPHKQAVAETLACVIQRADELSEFLAMYWKDGKQPLSAQVKKGLAAAFGKFDEYQLAKYNRDNAITLRDVLFLCHAKPKDAAQDALWKRLIDGELTVPDTWEVALSAQDGVSKKEKWERLLKEGRLGAMALLRNLRNMKQEQVDNALVVRALRAIKAEKVLPFRFIAAARYAPQWEQYLEDAMFKCLAAQEKASGKTVLLIDVSGSMDAQISARSEMTRMDAACGLAVLAREIYPQVEIFTFSNQTTQVPARRGFALRDAVVNSQPHSGTYLGKAIQDVEHAVKQYDRLIVLTDEQSHDRVAEPKGRSYLINVASNKNGVGYGAWTHIDGWSESVITYIQELERFDSS
ncbi:TROVE domain protein [Candidatus Moduliflexus flocculans]|uniref:TROVE domain protein n=1 Tax=Candidatus Moduliflexus flocculans TaxID=1499966 RepID=A0A081BR99_9BACT|nr:TROVE domain protein [Candidatus Moduliflexus flocculans]